MTTTQTAATQPATIATKPQPISLALAKATLVFQSEYGMGHHVVHVRDLVVEVRPYAQYRQAIRCGFVPKGKRNRRGLTQTYEPSLVVLDGHVDVAAANLWGEETVTASGATVQRGRASAFSESWDNEADAAVAAAMAAGARVVGDYRGFKTL